MALDKPVSPPKSDAFPKAANGATAGSYFVDGRYNIGGWSTYPSPDATFTKARASGPNDGIVRK